LRETLFNVLAPRIDDALFLDLCAGSGAVGIEALSRGARHVTFVDRSRKMCGLIEANLDLLQVPENQTEVVMAEAADFLRRPPARQKSSRVELPWDLVFFDPPYAADYFTVLELFGSQTADLLAEDGLLVVEHHHKNQLPEAIGALRRRRVLKQGDSALSFYESE
jgi:16S rRNA (guanine(966)-N(2))-methyltransferase RsmD